MTSNKLYALVILLFITSINQAQEVILTEDFESSSPGLPEGWTSESTSPGDGDFYIGDYLDANTNEIWPIAEHTQFAMANDDNCNCDMSAVYLISPTLNLTAVSGAILTYDFVDDGGFNQGGAPHKVEASSDGGLTWYLIYTFDMDNASIEWQTNTIGLGAATNDNANVKFRFKFDDNNDWNQGLAIDNIVVETNAPNNIAILSTINERFGIVNENTSVTVEVQNVGANMITSLSIDLNDGESNIEVVETSIAPGEVIFIQHEHTLTSSIVEEISYTVSILEINETLDSDPSNNEIIGYYSTLDQAPVKKPVFEEGTGTPCGWCPRGTVAMNYMSTNYPDFLGIAVHAYYGIDPMSIEEYEIESDFIAFPGMHVDRELLNWGISNELIESALLNRQQKLVPAILTGYSTGEGSNLTLHIDAEFFTPVSTTEYRIAVILTEDNVSGTTSDWDQANNYGDEDAGPMGGFEDLPGLVPASLMSYNHVARALIGGYHGQPGSVPGPITENYVASYSFNYFIPSDFDRENLHAIAILIDSETGIIVNGEKITVDAVSVEEQPSFSTIDFYPNPTSDFITVSLKNIYNDYSITITDVLGKVVLEQNYSNSSNSEELRIFVGDLNTGNYLLTYASNGTSYSKTLVIE